MSYHVRHIISDLFSLMLQTSQFEVTPNLERFGVSDRFWLLWLAFLFVPRSAL